MDDEQKYKLITCVDPRKINVPIRDRFAKLTLSNKKKQQQEIMEANEEDIEEKSERIKRVSRNLLEVMDNATVAKSPTRSSSLTDLPQYINPLLRSESSSSIPVTQMNISRLGSSNEYLSVHSSHTEDMQPLQVSENIGQTNDDDLLDQEISTLTKEVSIMAVSARSSNVNRNDKIAHDTTLLVSTESQRMSYEFHTQRLHTCTIKADYNDKQQSFSEGEAIQSACISLSSTDGSCSAITVTDSSVSDFMDFDVMTSALPESGRSADAFLPQTFSNDRADRMEAFLRDVSQQRRELEENEMKVEDNFTLLSVNDTTSAEEYVKDKNLYKEPGGLAYADTESMTTFSTEPRKSEDYEKLMKNMKCNNDYQTNTKLESRTKNDTLLINQNNSAAQHACSEISVLNKQEDQHQDSQRLAYDDTEVNSSLSEDISKPWLDTTPRQSTVEENKDYSIICSEPSYNSESIKQDIPEDSVVISETSSENVSGYSVHDGKCSSGDVVTSDCSPAVDGGSTQSQISPQQIGIGSINISAKINIKISISQVDSLEDEYEKESEDNDKAFENDTNIHLKTPLPYNQVLLETTCDEQRQDRSKINQSNAIENHMNAVTSSADEDEEDVNFLTHAERLLNQVYGKAWQTPEVIRTLKRSSRTPKKNCTPSPQMPKTPNSFKETSLVKDLKPTTDITSGGKLVDQSVEQSVLDDFSIFRRDIVRTNLDSTRFTTPKPHCKENESNVERLNFNSEPRIPAQHNAHELQNFKVPKTEVKKKLQTKQGRQKNVAVSAERWRQIVDDDSETSGDNASDDDTLDKTEKLDDWTDDNKENKDVEWNPSSSSDNNADSDYEISRPTSGVKGRTRKQLKYKTPRKTKTTDTTRRRQTKTKSKDALIYLDLSKDEVTIHEGEPNSPPANNDANFNTHLESILRTCKATDKPKLLSTPNTGSKRKLFTANFGDEDIDLTIGEFGVQPRTPVKTPAKTVEEDLLLQEMEQVNLNDGSTGGFAIFNKHLEFIKSGDPIFKVTPSRVPTTPKLTETPKQTKPLRTLRGRKKLTDNLWPTPNSKYGFLKSLDVCVSKALCHPDALCYRENYRNKKEELAKLLYELYNEKLFDNKLNVPLQWNKKLCNTAGRCLNKKKMGVRTSVVELSEKVLTSADRLRCTLIHELCHAATWIFSGEGGHGSTWKQWALKANHVFPEIPKIGVCHQYDIEYKYTYKCTLCAAKSHAHSKSKKVENIRCSFCHGAIEIFLNKKDKDGNILPTPVREPTGFAKFVKDNYKQYKRPDLKHADVMKILSAEFAALKIPECGK